MRRLNREIIRALKRLVIDTWNKDELDKSKAYLSKYADEIIDIMLAELREESQSPPKPCCGFTREKETLDLYHLVPTPRRLRMMERRRKQNEQRD